jgi:Family of unknown function (DUF5681)
MDQDDETPPNKMDRNRDGRFKKGQSGNPGGRPKIFTEVKQARHVSIPKRPYKRCSLW